MLLAICASSKVSEHSLPCMQRQSGSRNAGMATRALVQLVSISQMLGLFQQTMKDLAAPDTDATMTCCVISKVTMSRSFGV